ncbi:MAG TPA: MFS transporter [Jatrophihabitans sp.]|jgi:MFS family permease|nr:MFS transporter [Jatrophihabitans sp.]
MSFTSSRRDVSLIVVAKSVSWLGDMLAEVALVLRLQSHGAGAGAVAALLIANALPIVLLAGVVGRVVDRFDNHRLLLTSSLAQAAVCSVVAFVTPTPVVLALVAALGAGQAVNSACWQALLATVTSGDTLTRAIGRAQAGQMIAGIVAPAVSGLLVGFYGARLPLLLDALAYLLVACAAALIATRRMVAVAAPGEKQRGGLAIVRADSLLRPLFFLLGLFVLLGSMVNVVEVFLVRETLGASTTWYGFAGAALSVGALAGALLGGRLRGTAGLARGFVGSAVLLAAGIVAAGLVPTIGWLLPAIGAIGLMNGILNVTLASLVMGRTLAAERGRVSALLTGVASGTQLIAFAAGGALASVFAPRAIFVAAGVLGMLVPLLLGRGLIRSASRASNDAAPPLATVVAAA